MEIHLVFDIIRFLYRVYYNLIRFLTISFTSLYYVNAGWRTASFTVLFNSTFISSTSHTRRVGVRLLQSLTGGAGGFVSSSPDDLDVYFPLGQFAFNSALIRVLERLYTSPIDLGNFIRVQLCWPITLATPVVAPASFLSFLL